MHIGFKNIAHDIDWKTTRVFQENWNSESFIKLNRGGTRSTKTYSIAQIFLVWLLTSYYSRNQRCLQGYFSAIRKASTTIRDTAYRDFQTVISTVPFGLQRMINHKKTERSFEFIEWVDGHLKQRIVEFHGADDQQKMKGRSRMGAWLNEMDELTPADFAQIEFRTEHSIWGDFNPDKEDSWVREQLEDKRGADPQDLEVIVSTLLDNFTLSKKRIRRIMKAAGFDKAWWSVYIEGQYATLGHLIYKLWKKSLEEDIPEGAKKVVYGLDFGSANQTACAKMGMFNGEWWGKEMFYEVDLSNKEIAEMLQATGVTKDSVIVADSAEPDRIKELQNLGWIVVPSIKGQGSVKYGIGVLKSYNLNIIGHNFHKEFRNYKWKEVNGKKVDIPVGVCHLLDSLRYGMTFALGRQKGRQMDAQTI